jgi:DNA-binding MarR family transcriptional regulator
MAIVAMYIKFMGMPSKPTTGYLLWRVSMKWRASVDRALAPLGLTHAQYSLLAPLYGMSTAGREPSQRELAEFTGLEPIYVSKLARALERAGLIDRAEHPEDTRAVRLTLTGRGREVVREAITTVHELHAELTGPIGGPDSTGNRELQETLRLLLGET